MVHHLLHALNKVAWCLVELLSLDAMVEACICVSLGAMARGPGVPIVESFLCCRKVVILHSFYSGVFSRPVLNIY